MVLRLPLLLVLVTTMASCGKVKDPEFRRLEGFEVKSLGLQQVEIGFNVTYFNPNNFGVTVKEAVADFYIDSVFVGKFSQDESVEVGRNAEFSIPLSGSVPLATALQLKVTDLRNRDLLLRADGSVKVGKAGMFVSKPFKYSGKHKTNINL